MRNFFLSAAGQRRTIKLLLLLAISPSANFAQNRVESDLDLPTLYFKINTSLRQKQKYFDQKGNKGIADELAGISTVFNELLPALPTDGASADFKEALLGYSSTLEALRDTSSETTRDLLEEIRRDMIVKRAVGGSLKLEGSASKPIEVTVVTRKIVDGKEIDVPGYSVLYKPWFLKDTAKPGMSFTNPTLSAKRSISPGNYDIWVQKGNSPSKLPQKGRTRKRIPDTNDAKQTTVVIFVD